MVNIPNKFTQEIYTIIDWHLAAYIPEKMFNTHLTRILERFFEQNRVNGAVQVEASELYYISECVSDAINNISECGVEKSIVWEIFDWVREERKK